MKCIMALVWSNLTSGVASNESMLSGILTDAGTMCVLVKMRVKVVKWRYNRSVQRARWCWREQYLKIMKLSTSINNIPMLIATTYFVLRIRSLDAAVKAFRGGAMIYISDRFRGSSEAHTWKEYRTSLAVCQ